MEYGGTAGVLLVPKAQYSNTPIPQSDYEVKP